MKFFTPDLLLRFGSDDGELAQAAQEELEHRAEGYLRSLSEIEPYLPPRFRDLLDQFYLHDARVLPQSSMAMTDLERLEHSLRSGMPPDGEFGRRTPSFWIPLQLDTPPREILVLQYRSVEIENAEIHESLFEECPYLEWQHDEVDLVQSGEYTEFRHSILFTRGLEIRLRFRDFDFARLKPMEAAEDLVGLSSTAPSSLRDRRPKPAGGFARGIRYHVGSERANHAADRTRREETSMNAMRGRFDDARWTDAGHRSARSFGRSSSSYWGGPSASRPRPMSPSMRPLPAITPERLATRIRESWRSYDKGLLEVAFEVEDNQHNRAGIPVVPGSSPTVLVRYAGRYRLAHDGRRWRLSYDGQTIGSKCQLFPDHWATGFDGETHYQIDHDGKDLVLGEARREVEEFSPRELFWPKGKYLTESLDFSRPAIHQRTVDGVRCYVADIGIEEFLISPRQSHLVVRYTMKAHEQAVKSRRMERMRRDARGFWLPGQIVIEERVWPRTPIEPPPDAPPEGKPVAIPKAKPLPQGALPLQLRRTLRITRYDPGKVFRPEEFAFELPYGATVADRRLGFAYVNDPWWPEVQAMLKEQFADWFEWPIVDMSPLAQFTPPGLEGPNEVEGKARAALRGRFVDQFGTARLGRAQGQGHAGQVLQPGPSHVELRRFPWSAARGAAEAVRDLSSGRIRGRRDPREHRRHRGRAAVRARAEAAVCGRRGLGQERTSRGHELGLQRRR